MASPLFLLLKIPCGVTIGGGVTPQEGKKEGGEEKRRQGCKPAYSSNCYKRDSLLLLENPLPILHFLS